MTLTAYIRDAESRLEALYPHNEAANIVSLLLQDRLNMQAWQLPLNYQMEVPDNFLGGDMEQLLGGCPLQYVLGYTEFYGRHFKVSPAVLIPRPDTEALVEKILEHCPRNQYLKVLDLCTGSGCLAWTVAAERPFAEVTAVDISEEALEVAKLQKIKEGKVNFVKGDALSPEFLTSLGQFDIVVCNPPYIMESEKAEMHRNVLEHEPALALFVPDDDPLLFYKALAANSGTLLKPEAFLAVECNEKLSGEVAKLFKNSCLTGVSVFKSLAGKPLFVEARRKPL